MNYILAFIAFNVIVIVHELGHFLAAKKFGIKVDEFSLFVGPKLWSIQRGETTYSLRPIPIMAYVKMEGEEEPSASERAFNNKPRYARALTIFGGPLANLLLAAILLTILFLFQGYDTNVIKSVQKDSSASAIGLQEGDRIISYGGKSVYLPLDVVQFLYVSKGKTAEVEYIRNNEKHTETLVPVKSPAYNKYMLGVSFKQENEIVTNTIASVMQGYPAQVVGLRAGDRIIRINDTDITTGKEIQDYLAANKDKEISIAALRGNSQVNVELIPKIEKVPDQYFIGLEFDHEKGNLWDSFREASVFTYSIVRSVAYSLVWLFTGQVELNQMMGPIGMVSTIGSAVQQGPNALAKLFYLIQVTGLMSIAIGATNLIPFPMLDGNRLLLIGIEAIRRKPLKPEREAFISMVGFVLIILIAVYAAFNDIMRLING